MTRQERAIKHADLIARVLSAKVPVGISMSKFGVFLKIDGGSEVITEEQAEIVWDTMHAMMKAGGSHTR